MRQLLNEAFVWQTSRLRSIHRTPAPLKDPRNEVHEPASGHQHFCGAWGVRGMMLRCLFRSVHVLSQSGRSFANGCCEIA